MLKEVGGRTKMRTAVKESSIREMMTAALILFQFVILRRNSNTIPERYHHRCGHDEANNCPRKLSMELQSTPFQMKKKGVDGAVLKPARENTRHEWMCTREQQNAIQ